MRSIPVANFSAHFGKQYLASLLVLLWRRDFRPFLISLFISFPCFSFAILCLFGFHSLLRCFLPGAILGPRLPLVVAGVAGSCPASSVTASSSSVEVRVVSFEYALLVGTRLAQLLLKAAMARNLCIDHVIMSLAVLHACPYKFGSIRTSGPLESFRSLQLNVAEVHCYRILHNSERCHWRATRRGNAGRSLLPGWAGAICN